MKWFKLKFSLEYKNRGYIFAPRTQSQVVEWILHLEGTVEQKKKKCHYRNYRGKNTYLENMGAHIYPLFPQNMET